jgi:hypothetical protein
MMLRGYAGLLNRRTNSRGLVVRDEIFATLAFGPQYLAGAVGGCRDVKTALVHYLGFKE